ncbi:hypothetical protein D3C75_1020880 [compost metagenome]
MAVRDQYGRQDVLFKERQQVEPLVRSAAQAAVVEVVAVDIDTSAQRLRIKLSLHFLHSRNEKTGLSRLFPPPTRWSCHAGREG